MSTNYYKFLNINQDADRDTIRKACRDMRLKYHPDTRAKDIDNTKADEQIRKLNVVCATLQDNDDKIKYDKTILNIRPRYQQSTSESTSGSRSASTGPSASTRPSASIPIVNPELDELKKNIWFVGFVISYANNKKYIDKQIENRRKAIELFEKLRSDRDAMVELSMTYSTKINNLIAEMLGNYRNVPNALAGALSELDSFIDLDIELDANRPILKEYNFPDKTTIKAYMERVRNRPDIKDVILRYSPEYINTPEWNKWYGKKEGGAIKSNYYSKYIKYKNKYLIYLL